MFFCFVLFTVAVCFKAIDGVQDHAKDNPIQDTNSKNCNCENGKCVTDKQGHTKCVCKPGFALQDELTCKPCDCGSLGKCIFILKQTDGDKYEYQKTCVCDSGKTEKDGTCVDCFCGENSECDFDHGERRCFCIEGYSENNGTCTKCECGFNGACEYENGNKKCECDEGYLELSGVCEACDCGSNSENCSLVDGAKKCTCKDGYADFYGTCDECYCGNYTRDCNFNDNQKTCNCLEGYVQKGEKCEPGCSAQNPCQNGGYCKGGFCFCQKGTRGEFCELINDCSTLCPNKSDIKCAYDIGSQKAYCRCLNNNLRYNPKVKQCRGTCRDDGSCQNQGKCTGAPELKFCDCLEGTGGDFCEDVPACRGINCGSDAYCVFNPSTKKAGCKCKDANLKYDSSIGRCRWLCNTDSDCFNGAVCGQNSYCYCPPGTQGARCQIVDDCYFGRIRCFGDNAYCAFDLNMRMATCKCKNPNEVYDFNLGACRGFCRSHAECYNGGSCGWDGLCYCLPGTQGPRCEVVDACYFGQILCYGGPACCVFDLITRSPTCIC